MEKPEIKIKEEDASDRDLIQFIGSSNKVLGDVVLEAYASGQENGPYHSAHEAYADLLQQMDQIKEHVWTLPSSRDLLMMEREVQHLASACLRMILDVCQQGKNTYDPGEGKDES
uniref:Uncharacterized protein n=1 Tax=viral metagenome TaxID=1070528 RepID=A0A6M3IMA6_9ZZZZ